MSGRKNIYALESLHISMTHSAGCMQLGLTSNIFDRLSESKNEQVRRKGKNQLTRSCVRSKLRVRL